MNVGENDQLLFSILGIRWKIYRCSRLKFLFLRIRTEVNYFIPKYLGITGANTDAYEGTDEVKDMYISIEFRRFHSIYFSVGVFDCQILRRFM